MPAGWRGTVPKEERGGKVGGAPNGGGRHRDAAKTIRTCPRQGVKATGCLRRNGIPATSLRGP